MAGVVVNAAQDQVWELALDWARQREWIWATRVEGGHGLGAGVTGWTGVGPVGFTDPMVITEWDPPRRCAVQHLGALVRGYGVFEVLPHADVPSKGTGTGSTGAGSTGAGGSGPVTQSSRSQFRWTERIELPLPPAVGLPIARAIVGPAARIGLGWSLRRFARLVNLADSPVRGRRGVRG